MYTQDRRGETCHSRHGQLLALPNCHTVSCKKAQGFERVKWVQGRCIFGFTAGNQEYTGFSHTKKKIPETANVFLPKGIYDLNSFVS